MSEAPAGLYLHLPFCARVCPYCDFAVRTGDRDRRRRFVDHLLAEIELYADYPLRFDTVYLGGGTPSHLDVAELARILDTVRAQLRLDETTSFFLEANPEDVTRESTTAWRRIGIDTLSLGVQSLDTAGLAFLGRCHTVDEARQAVGVARQAGFQTVSIDLIYGRPGQRQQDWRRELALALELEADHISCYQLTIHQRTRFGLLEKRGRLTQLEGDAQAGLFQLTHRQLNDSGLQGYEVSQFAAAPEHRSRHNVKYWNHTPYLGLGPSAHSFHEDRRWWNIRRTDPWQQRLDQRQRPVDEVETLDRRALTLEALMTGLRTYAGVDLTRLQSRFDLDLAASNAALIDRLESQGLASIRDGQLIPTLDGLALADSIASSFRLDSGH